MSPTEEEEEEEEEEEKKKEEEEEEEEEKKKKKVTGFYVKTGEELHVLDEKVEQDLQAQAAAYARKGYVFRFYLACCIVRRCVQNTVTCIQPLHAVSSPVGSAYSPGHSAEVLPMVLHLLQL